MPEREHILCVDDEEGILLALRQQLGRRFGHECDADVALSAREALDLADDLARTGETLAIAVVDQIMPGMKGVELLEELHRRQPRCMKILLTGQAGLDAVVAAINRAGLHRYIGKPWEQSDLELAVENLLRQFRLDRDNRRLLEDLRGKNQELTALNASLERMVEGRTRELREANDRLAQLATTDGLTGLANHRHFQERLALEVERSRRSELPLSLLMIDVDHFKAYNDRHGHPAGDAVLRAVAEALREGRRANDLVARYGGEEFALLLPGAEREAALGVAEQLRRRIGELELVGGDGKQGERLTISVGVAACPRDADRADLLIAEADRALYAAKAAGRNRVEASVARVEVAE